MCRACITDTVKNMNVKVFNLTPGVNETRIMTIDCVTGFNILKTVFKCLTETYFMPLLLGFFTVFNRLWFFLHFLKKIIHAVLWLY